MLGYWRPHNDYQTYLIEKISPIFLSDRPLVEQYEKALSKLYSLDLDPLKPIIEGYYSHTGAPAANQPELFRSFILMSELKVHSIPKWVRMMRNNRILAYMVGLEPSQTPGVGSHYDLVNRLWLENPEVEYESLHSLHNYNRKPHKKLKKNQKQPPRHPGIIQKLVDLALQGASFDSRPELLMQQIFAKVGVEPSAKAGLLGDVKKLSVSGDGTCINSGGSSYGVKVCDCVKQGVYNCDCKRKFSDPGARWGWDSYHENWFYGYSEYILSTHNKNLKCELPLYLRLVQASRFDGVSAVVALQEAQLLYDEYIIIRFHGDGAHDNYAMYEYLDKCGIKAFIPLNETNKGNFKHPPYVRVDENGVPICMAGHKAVFWGFNKDRCRLKYRCPLATGKIASCPYKGQCSSSDYGRCFYTKPSWDLRLFTEVPRGSIEWKEEMNSRTSSERVNKRLLNDYGLELSRTRGKKRIFWWSVIHSVNIHLDARLKASVFSFVRLLENRLATAA
ncbi:MAG: hypothetical protein QHH06_10195 [Clostridiales bacterium]|jgi:hypothetical protein|nr:hypothetical protein [Eubacteriales bacterium]MDH7566835.1 hypothetical protein [Clostridiales bacterium]